MHSTVPSYCGTFTFMNTHDGCPRYATIWPKTWPLVVWKVPVRSCDPWGTCAAADVGAGWCSCSVTTAVPATSNPAAAAATRTVRTRSLLAGRGSGMLGDFACSDSRWNNPSTNGSVGAASPGRAARNAMAVRSISASSGWARNRLGRRPVASASTNANNRRLLMAQLQVDVRCHPQRAVLQHLRIADTDPHAARRLLDRAGL